MTYLLPLATRSLMLRQFGEDDASKVFAMSREAGISEWLPDQVYKDEADALSVIRFLTGNYSNPRDPAKVPFVLGVCLKESGELIGHVGLSPYRGEVEIGYAIEDRQKGRGYATEAVLAMRGFAFERFGIMRVLGIVHRENSASCRVLEKAGFSLMKEEHRTLNGRYGQVREYAGNCIHI